jgi:hypothetical protein
MSSSSSSSPSLMSSEYSHKLYLGLSARDNQTVSPSISCYGLDYKLTTPSKIDILHHNHNPSESYPLYRQHLAAHVSATSLGHKVAIKSKTGFYHLNKIAKSSDFIPLPLPHLYVRCKKPFKTEIENKLKTLTMYKSTTIKSSTTLYDFRNPSYETFKFLMSHSDNVDTKTQVPNSVINMEAMKTYMRCLNIVTQLLRTHNYASPKQIPSTDIEISAKLTILEYNELKIKKRNLDSINISSPTSSDSIKKKIRVEVGINPVSSSSSAIINTSSVDKGENKQDSDDMDDSTSSSSSTNAASTPNVEPNTPSNKAVHVDNVDIQDQIIVKLESRHITDIKVHAKPTKQTTKTLHGLIGDAPNLPGVYLPYLVDLAGDDSTYVPSFIRLHLAKLLGDNMKDAGLVLNEIYQHWGLIGSTKAGKQMTHLFFCINIALECEGLCYPIIGNQGCYVYEGCAVFGHDFELMVDKVIYKPVPYLELMKTIQQSDTHTTILLQIYTIVSGDERSNSEMDEKAIDEEINTINSIDNSSMRKLSKSLLKLKLTDEQKKKINEVARYLQFEEPYYEVKGENVIECLHLILSNKEYDDRAPLHYTAILSSDIYERNLAVFGPRVPVLNIPHGKKIEIVDDFQKCPEPFWYNIIDLFEAVIDWKRMIRSKYIINQSTSFGTKNQFYRFNNDERKRVWKTLNEAIGNIERDNKEERKVELPSSDDAGY